VRVGLIGIGQDQSVRAARPRIESLELRRHAARRQPHLQGVTVHQGIEHAGHRGSDVARRAIRSRHRSNAKTPPCRGDSKERCSTPHRCLRYVGRARSRLASTKAVAADENGSYGGSDAAETITCPVAPLGTFALVRGHVSCTASDRVVRLRAVAAGSGFRRSAPSAANAWVRCWPWQDVSNGGCNVSRRSDEVRPEPGVNDGMSAAGARPKPPPRMRARVCIGHAGPPVVESPGTATDRS
jgi:hypothetical protein